MSFTMHGVGVSGGIAIGHAHLVVRNFKQRMRYQVRMADGHAAGYADAMHGEAHAKAPAGQASGMPIQIPDIRFDVFLIRARRSGC